MEKHPATTNKAAAVTTPINKLDRVIFYTHLSE
jgi:hypothetical protein